MQHDYDIILRGTIELGGVFSGETREEAIAAAKLELRSSGDLTDITVERIVLLDFPDDTTAPITKSI